MDCLETGFISRSFWRPPVRREGRYIHFNYLPALAGEYVGDSLTEFLRIKDLQNSGGSAQQDHIRAAWRARLLRDLITVQCYDIADFLKLGGDFLDRRVIRNIHKRGRVCHYPSSL